MANMPALPTWVDDHSYRIIFLVLCCLLLAHRFRSARYQLPYGLLLLLWFLMIVGAFGFVAMMFEPVDIWTVFLFIAVYGVALYIFLCEVLLLGIARWLTDKRGEKWVKELDYVYLMLGVVGILGSVNRIDQVTGRFSKVDILAPMVLVTAVVIRLIKTRAEIGAWTKLASDPGHALRPDGPDEHKLGASLSRDGSRMTYNHQSDNLAEQDDEVQDVMDYVIDFINKKQRNDIVPERYDSHVKVKVSDHTFYVFCRSVGVCKISDQFDNVDSHGILGKDEMQRCVTERLEGLRVTPGKN